VRVVSLTRATLSLLEKAALRVKPGGKQLRKQLLFCVMTPAAVRLLERGLGGWCNERMKRFLNRRGHTWDIKKGETPVQVSGKGAKYRVLQKSMDQLLLSAQEKYADIFLELHAFAMARGIDPRRVHVANLRMVEPLAEWRASALFEPHPKELTPEEQRRFLRYGMLREKILMGVELSNSQARANTLARGELPSGILASET
jgi:hypothetical protein